MGDQGSGSVESATCPSVISSRPRCLYLRVRIEHARSLEWLEPSGGIRRGGGLMSG